MQKEKFDKFLSFTKKAFEDVAMELVSLDFTLTEEYKPKDNNKVVVIIGVTGKSKGRILLECDMETAQNFTVAMNFGDPLDDSKDLYFYIAEFANMICGRTVTHINNEFKERETWLSPPAIFSGEDLEIITPAIQSETVRYSGECGTFLIDVGFEGGN